MTREECQTCNDPTKYPWAFWDGKGETHGQLYSCYNLGCKIKQNELKQTEECSKSRLDTEKINQSNLISIDLIKQKRKELQITTKKMADGLGINCSLYCDYEQCRKPVPVETMDRINAIFRSNISQK